jgi:hypothetical protein
MSLKAPFSPHKKLFYRHISGTEKRTSPRFFAGLHKRDGRPLGARLGTSQQNQLISISTFLYAEVLPQGFLTLALAITRTL